MPEPKTQCAECGRTILVATANKTDGCCLPCSNGTRQGIDAARRRAEGDKAFRASPVWKFWERLVASDFAALSPPKQVYLAVNELRDSVWNGSFDSDFSTFGEHASAAEAGLVTLKVEGPLQVFREARHVLASAVITSELSATNVCDRSGGSSVTCPHPDPLPRERETLSARTRRALNDPAIDRQLDELDRRFYAAADGLWDALQEFGVQQGFSSDGLAC